MGLSPLPGFARSSFFLGLVLVSWSESEPEVSPSLDSVLYSAAGAKDVQSTVLNNSALVFDDASDLSHILLAECITISTCWYTNRVTDTVLPLVH